LWTVTWVPVWVNVPSQSEVTRAAAGRSNSSVQLVVATVPALVIRYVASYPVPQSELFVKVAVRPPAADADAGARERPATTRAAAIPAVRRARRRNMVLLETTWAELIRRAAAARWTRPD
jgi:hypothetical protein